MPLEIPNLRGTNVIRLKLAFYIDGDNINFLNWIKSVGDRHRAQVGEGWWLHDAYFQFQEDGGQLVGCAILLLDQNEGIGQLEPTMPIELLQERFTHVNGERVSARLVAAYHTPLDKIPPNGKIDALIGVTTDTERIRLEYTGAKTKLHGSIFTDFSWELVTLPKGGGQVIESEVDSWLWNYGVPADDALVKAAHLSIKAYDFFVLDKPADIAICTPSTGT
jgi:hypothetical protein